MNRTVVLVVVVVLVIGALALFWSLPAASRSATTASSTSSGTNAIASSTSGFTGEPTEIAAVEQVVAEFSSQLQRVSLQSSNAAPQMEEFYGLYVAPTLLAQWEASPMAAPGRSTSSPWPDRIVVDTATKQPDGTYAVTGSVIEKTSTGDGSSYPVSATLAQINGAWLIQSWSGYPPAPPHPAP